MKYKCMSIYRRTIYRQKECSKMPEQQHDPSNDSAFIIAYAAFAFSGAIMGFAGGVLACWLW